MRRITTRFAAMAAAAGLALLPLTYGIAAGPAEPGTDAAATHAPAPSPAPSGAPSDAAAKHIHRTACLRDARKKKLLGAEKTAFLKNCIGVPG
ncbi:MAG TPA: hypothetical protein VN692_06480 [Steroidobacteraceae bacterium]|nr:hypothetical protein [Steroidobacteraceae bacterium]